MLQKTLIVAVLAVSSWVAQAEAPAAWDVMAPDPPNAIEVAKKYTSVTLSWDRIPRVSSYTVEYRVKRYFLWESTKRVENYQSTSYQLRFPYSLSRYTFRIYAVAGPAVSRPSKEVSVTSPLFGGTEILYITA